MPPTPSPFLRPALAGAAATCAGNGLARFAYVPLSPAMVAAGWVARTFDLGMALVALSLAARAWNSGFPWLMGWRFMAGVMGQRLFVDHAGQTVGVVEAATGEAPAARLVGRMGPSSAGTAAAIGPGGIGPGATRRLADRSDPAAGGQPAHRYPAICFPKNRFSGRRSPRCSRSVAPE